MQASGVTVVDNPSLKEHKKVMSMDSKAPVTDIQSSDNNSKIADEYFESKKIK